jgi:pyrroline-5-carboxylate reductase
MTEAIDGKLVISICAGVTLAQLRSWVPASTEVVRAMPNTPCKVSLYLPAQVKRSPLIAANNDRYAKG